MKKPKSRFPELNHISMPEQPSFHTTPWDRTRMDGMPRVLELDFKKEPTTNPFGFPDGHWVMGGGISWPMNVQDEGLVGIAHLGGLHLETRSIWIFSERKFIVMDLSADYPIDAPRPLKTWLEACYELFFHTTYYYQDIQTTSRKFITSARKCFQSAPRPYFVSFPWVNMKASMQTVQEYYVLGRLHMDPTSRLDTELSQFDAEPDEDYPALFSATVLINALDKFVNSQYLIEKVIANSRSI